MSVALPTIVTKNEKVTVDKALLDNALQKYSKSLNFSASCNATTIDFVVPYLDFI